MSAVIIEMMQMLELTTNDSMLKRSELEEIHNLMNIVDFLFVGNAVALTKAGRE